MSRLLLILLLSLPASAQLWSGYIPASRAVDWSKVGATGNGSGGACASKTVYNAKASGYTFDATDFGSGTIDIASSVNTALTTAASLGEQVKLGPGTFLLVQQIKLPNASTFCGAGADQTILDYRGTQVAAITTTGYANVGVASNVSTSQWLPANAYGVQNMSVPAGTYSGTLAATCNNGGFGLNNGAGPSLAKGSNCFGVGSAAYMTVKASGVAPGAVGQPQGFLQMSVADDGSTNITGGINPSTAIATSTGTSGPCNGCDGYEQKSYYGLYPNGYWKAGTAYSVNQYVMDFNSGTAYIWQVNSIQGSGISGSTNPFPSYTNPPTINSTTVKDCNPSPCTGSDTNVITWLAVDIANRSQGQMARISGVDGPNNVVTIDGGLNFDYTAARNPHASPFGLIQNVTLGDFQFYYDAENGAGQTSGVSGQKNIVLWGCYNGTIRGIESNYTLYQHVEVDWSLNTSVINSYLTNMYRHDSGTFGEGGVALLYKTSNSLVANNIIERLHNCVNYEWGVSGNVVAYNKCTGNFHRDLSTTQMDYVNHGATPTMNLFEGNDGSSFGEDGIWGNQAWTTFFRNRARGTNVVCVPQVFSYGTDANYISPYMNTPRAGVFGQPAVTCSPGPGSAWNISYLGYWPTSGSIVSPNGWNGWQSFHAAYAMNIGALMTQLNVINNVVGSTPMTQLLDYTPQGGQPYPTTGPSVPWLARVWTFCGMTGSPSPSGTNYIKCGPGSRPFSGGEGYTFGYASAANDTGGGVQSSQNSWNGVLIDHDFSYLDYYCLTQTTGPCAGDTTGGVWSHNPNQLTASFPASLWLASQPTWGTTGFDWPNTIPWPSIGSDVTASSFAATTIKGDPAYNYHVPNGCSMPAECVWQQIGGQEGGAGSPLSGFNENLYNSGAPTTHTLTVTSASGTVTSNPAGINCGATCSAVYSAGTVVTLTAVPNPGFTVNNWTGADSACTGQLTCTVTMAADESVTVNYSATPTYNLTITASNGTVSPTPVGLNCGANCYTYASGTSVTLLASPNAGYNFSSWSGGCTGTANPCSVTMSGNASVTANFSAAASTGANINGSVLMNGGVVIH